MKNKLNRTSKSFQYHIYVTMNCSLKCDHCFINDTVRKEKRPMTIEEFKRIVDAYSEHFKKSDAQKAELTIIGGEPTLLSPSFFLEAIPYLRKSFEESGKFFYISLVTNLLHFSSLRKIYPLFDYISTSYEPERFSKEEDKNKLLVWKENVKKVRELGIELSLSVTTTSGVVRLGNDYLEEMYKLGFKKFQINLSIPEGKMLKNAIGDEVYGSYSEVRTEDFEKPVYRRKPLLNVSDSSIFPGFKREAEFMIGATEWLLDKSLTDQDVDVYPISSYCTSVFEKMVVGDIACCADMGLNARVDGQVTGCATEIGSENIFSYGNIYDDSIEDIVESRNAKLFKKNTNLTKRECLACEFYSSCEGACMLRAKLWNPRERDSECHGLKSFYEYIEKNAHRLENIDKFK